MQPDQQAQPLDVLWGAQAIAEVINRTERQTKHMLSKGELPGKKVGGRWCASRSRLKAYFEGEADHAA
ncbi:DNA-binding protein [Devosia sp. XK-2]|uniref:DNA-binding protein n=1 Tax=Devosia sp. XK-2 TaxID=3126689 RepID=UPI0030D3A771